MSDQPENFVLVYLRGIDEKLDRVIDELNGLKTRTTAAEEAIVGLNRRLDRIDSRLDRIEKRFDRVDAYTTCARSRLRQLDSAASRFPFVAAIEDCHPKIQNRETPIT